MTTYLYGGQQQTLHAPARAYVIEPPTNPKVMTDVAPPAAAAAADDSSPNAAFLGPFAAAAAICGFIAFLVNPLFGMFAIGYGVRSVMVMAHGRLADAHYAAKTAMWFSVFSVVIGMAAYIALSVLLRHKPEWFIDNALYVSYLPNICLPLFAW